VFDAPIDLDLPGDQRVQPDLVVLPWMSVGEPRLRLPVLLVVEILSTGSRTHDQVTKRTVYAEAGIPAYWLIDPSQTSVTALRLGADREYHTYAQGSAVELDWPVQIVIDVPGLARRPT
jgi:Uma2 family endonuclease